MGLLTGNAAEHRYEQCGDDYCQRFACRVYKQGYSDGWRDGHLAGYAEGYTEGFSEGYAEGASDAGE
jgi:flagellar biosynthesis/type III secretory pathway protein FliH